MDRVIVYKLMEVKSNATLQQQRRGNKMYWIELNTLARDGMASKKILCNLELVSCIEDCQMYNRGTCVQYDSENYFYVEEKPEQILAALLIHKPT